MSSLGANLISYGIFPNAFGNRSFDANLDLHFFFSVEISYIENRELSEGKLFFAPWKTFSVPQGPFIYDEQGQPLWSGHDVLFGADTHGLQTCEYEGSPHLCVWQGQNIEGLGRGAGLILDESYRIARYVNGKGKQTDFHEFHLVDDGRAALMLLTQPVAFDFASLDPTRAEKLSWLIDGGFQKIDVQTGEALFTWMSYGHIDPRENFLHPSFEHDGSGVAKPWDYVHLNSIAQTASSDFILSARHTNTVYRISGTDGAIMWRLGGRASDFEMDFTLGYQHDVRVLEETETSMTLSLFNNGWDGHHQRLNKSYGMTVELDLQARTARNLSRYDLPTSISCESKGNLQTLFPSGNRLVNWGNHPIITEHADNGSLIATIEMPPGVKSYRVFKSPWVGRPQTAPDVWVYSRTNVSKIAVYVSWNGATEVCVWRFFEEAPQPGQNAILLGSTNRTGFETLFVYGTHVERVFAEALSADGISLANSSVVSPFIPGSLLAQNCDELQCNVSVADTRRVIPLPTDDAQFAFTTVAKNLWIQVVDWMKRILIGLGVCYLWGHGRVGRRCQGLWSQTHRGRVYKN